MRSCLRYEPDTVRLTGILQRLTFPGRPNYESIRAGDEPETHFYLRLPRAVCARGRPVSDGELDAAAVPRDSVRLVQLVLDEAGYDRLRPRLGRPVAVRGTLFSSFTGHHHAPLVLMVLPPIRVTK